ncbi:hypothetical protein NF681_02130 (plasmid) [Comamonadaceae bacterium OTU4NAUVB1]|nr:hypothetical protein NF681_02130 [Comamonadaceae bacterium OTU4NAUVB1]
MTTLCNHPFFSLDQPFLRNHQGWKLFLNIRQTLPGPLHEFLGTVTIEAGEGRPGAKGRVREMECARPHTTCAEATRDAMNLAQVILAVIDAALDADGSSVENILDFPSP